MADENTETNESNEDGLLDDGQQQQQDKPPVEKKPTETDELRSAMTELTGTVKTLADTKKKDDEPEITEEQKKEFWAIYDPEATQKDFFKKFFRLNPDATPEDIKEMKDLFADVHKGIVKQAVRGAMNLVAVETDKIREEFKGISEYVAKQRAKETRDSFNDAYPVLADKKYDKIVALTAKNLDKDNFKTDEEYFKALAEGAAEVINAVRSEAGQEEIDLGAKPEKKPAATTPKLPRSSAGGTGGAGGGSTKENKGSKDGTDELLD